MFSSIAFRRADVAVAGTHSGAPLVGVFTYPLVGMAGSASSAAGGIHCTRPLHHRNQFQLAGMPALRLAPNDNGYHSQPGLLRRRRHRTGRCRRGEVNAGDVGGRGVDPLLAGADHRDPTTPRPSSPLFRLPDGVGGTRCGDAAD